MTPQVLQRGYDELPIDFGEVLRYAKVGSDSPEIDSLIGDVATESLPLIHARVCYTELDIGVVSDKTDLGFALTDSRDLKKRLAGCEKIILFAATVGGKIDRLTAKYAIREKTKALLLQALGTERIETLADAFCADMKKEAAARGYAVTQRFSPGYGDLSLELQRDIFRVLDCSRKIGLTLNESLLMSPTKSITAIIGLKNENN